MNTAQNTQNAEVLNLTFWSRTMQDVTYGKGDKARTFQVSALKQFFCSVKPGQDGWFAAAVKLPRDRATALYHRVKAAAPDLVAETMAPSQPVEAPKVNTEMAAASC